MAFVSTRGRAAPASFREALFAGVAPDGGLYVPAVLSSIPTLRDGSMSLVDIGVEIAAHLIGDEISRPALQQLLTEALDFPAPLVPLDQRISVLELFHGPTFAFKDVGARVMARLMAYFNDEHMALTVLVATSGDTGSAVAQAFHRVPGTQVVVLFPHGQVTAVQEAQFTTLGDNVRAVAVNGSFDDCQRLAKDAFADRGLCASRRLTSANSINIGRLLPQIFYYAHVASQLGDERTCLSVPSGNFGNLTAGLFAQRLGARIGRFVAATTINDTLPRYLASGHYEPKASVCTLANAMDVGDPSNVERMRWLFDDDAASMREVVRASVHTDAEVRAAIRDVWDRYGYLCDPHTAIGFLGLGSAGDVAGTRVFLATAHPAKFREVVEPIVGQSIPLPAALAEALARPRFVEKIEPRLEDLRKVIPTA